MRDEGRKSSRSADLLDTAALEQVLERLPRLCIGVLGDLFLDRYLDLDASLTEPSVETGLEAYQVARVRASPGAAGTVVNNLVALGVGRVCPVAVVGDDGEGYELRQALDRLGVDTRGILVSPLRRTPTYTKPLLHEKDQPPRELHRLDIKNRSPLPGPLQEQLLQRLHALWPQVDGLAVLDQVSEAECGVVTTGLRHELARLGTDDPQRLILADSRCRIGHFRRVTLKPNRAECLAALAGSSPATLEAAVEQLAAQVGGAVLCTDGPAGIVLADAPPACRSVRIPGYPVRGPIDIVGAGDSTSAAIVCARAAGLSLPQAAAFGCLVASITIQQIGTTGTATPDQVRQRWQEVGGA
jgi:bifunctional ADP-heptose synthase (sugar kinase/adenylyltransferase)